MSRVHWTDRTVLVYHDIRLRETDGEENIVIFLSLSHTHTQQLKFFEDLIGSTTK
jgi:hypothetical protein